MRQVIRLFSFLQIMILAVCFLTPAKVHSQIIDSSSFASKFDFTTASNPDVVAICDVDGDGKPDLLVADNGSNTVSVFRNTSASGSITASSFAPKVDFTTGSLPTSVAICDVDGDGKPDLVVTNWNSNTVSVFRNTSTAGSITAGSFAPKVDFTTGSGPSFVAIGDVDGDGKPDLVVANWTSSTVSVFRNTSASGSITASSFAPKVDFTTGTNPEGVAICDVDGDGKPDLVVANNGSNTVSVFRNTRSSGSITASSFAPKVDFTTGTTPEGVAISDVDGDGKSDLVVINWTSSTVSVFRNTSASGSITASSFAPKVDFTTGTNPEGAAICDVDGDGKPDLVVANNGSNTVSVFRNTGSSGSITASSFAPKVDFTTGSGPFGVAISDVDGDGKPDLVVTNFNSNTVSIFRNTILLTPQRWTFTLPLMYRDTSYSIFFEADSTLYSTLKAQYANPLGAQAMYLMNWLSVHGALNTRGGYPITTDSIYAGSQPVTSPTLRAEILKAALLWGYYYGSDNVVFNGGGIVALKADSVAFAQLYANVPIQYLGIALAKAIDIATIVGPLISDLNNLFNLNSSESEQIQNFINLIDDIVMGKDSLQADYPNTWTQIVSTIPGSNAGSYDNLKFVLNVDGVANPNLLANQLYNAAYPTAPMSQGAAAAAGEVLSGLGANFLENATAASLDAGASFAISYFGYGLSATTASQIATSEASEGVISFAVPLSLASFIVDNYIGPQAQLLMEEVNLETSLATDVFPGLLWRLENSMLVGNNANADAGIEVANLVGLTYVYESLWFSADSSLQSYEWLTLNGEFTPNTDPIDAQTYAGLAQGAYKVEEAAATQSSKGVLTAVHERTVSMPNGFALRQNYPNPFNPSTTISYQLPTQSHVTLKLYDILGREVRTLVNAEQEPGNYSRIVDANGLPSGVYFYRLQAGNFTDIKKMLLLK